MSWLSKTLSGAQNTIQSVLVKPTTNLISGIPLVGSPLSKASEASLDLMTFNPKGAIQAGKSLASDPIARSAASIAVGVPSFSGADLGGFGSFSGLNFGDLLKGFGGYGGATEPSRPLEPIIPRETMDTSWNATPLLFAAGIVTIFLIIRRK